MKRDTFLPSISTLLIFGMTVFLSCAHQNRVDETALNEEEVSAEQATAPEEGATNPETAEGTPSGELSELSPEPSTATPEEVSLEGAQPTADASQATVENQDLAALGAEDKSLENLSPEGQAPVDTTAGALSTEGTETAQAAAPTEPATDLDPLTNLGADTAAAGAVTDLNAETSQTTSSLANETTTTPGFTNDVPITRMEPIISPVGENRASFSGGERSRFSGTSHVPTIPSQAVTRSGAKLNRFYFVRQGDTSASVSTLLYGNPDQAKQLSQWNGRHWKAGKLIYYQSPQNPNEEAMRSFYQERNVSPEEYTIGRGDWLSKVAKKKLGASGSWKEIAVVNGMKTPDSLEVGHKIAIYPKDLGSYSGTTVATNEAPSHEEPRVEQPVAPPQQPEQQTPPQNQVQPVDPNQELANQQVPPPQQPVIEPPSPPVQNQQPAVDASKVVEQNLPAVFILGGVLVLSVLYLMVRRKRSSKSSDEFSDDNFAPPTKLKRK